jgi:hypothetical protein
MAPPATRVAAEITEAREEVLIAQIILRWCPTASVKAAREVLEQCSLSDLRTLDHSLKNGLLEREVSMSRRTREKHVLGKSRLLVRKEDAESD